MRHFSIRTLCVTVAICSCGPVPPGANGPLEAKAANQRVSAAIFNSVVVGFSGTKTDGVKCNAEFRDVGWCETAQSVVFCDGDQWRIIACKTVLNKDAAVCTVDAEKVVQCAAGTP